MSGYSLKAEDIKLLKSNGNFCDDWSLFKIVKKAADSLKNIRNCNFFGEILISEFIGIAEVESIGFKHKKGLYNSNFYGKCEVGNCLIMNCTCVRNVVAEDNCILLNCFTITAKEKPAAKSCDIFCLGPETGNAGKRCSCLWASKDLINPLSYADLCTVILSSCENRNNNMENHKHIPEREAILSNVVKVCSNSVLMNVETVSCSYIGAYCTVSNHCVLDNSVVLSNKENPTIIQENCSVRSCLLYPGTSVLQSCVVESTLLYSTSKISVQAKVYHTVLAPDSSISCGESHHSLIGPFVGFHHTSLLISAVWPHGRGNIAYGAMVGGNHTGRMNDQECLLGEGVFWGLGTSVKFPFNCLEGPYSIIAGGTSCLQPMRFSFPFSLVFSSKAGISVKPAWVLYSNPYFLARSTQKFQSRRKSDELTTDFPIKRPYIIDLVIHARNQLNFQTKYDIIVENIDAAIDGYSKFIHGYALDGLLTVLDAMRLQFCGSETMECSNRFVQCKRTSLIDRIVQQYVMEVSAGEHVNGIPDSHSHYQSLLDDLALWTNTNSIVQSEHIKIFHQLQVLIKELSCILRNSFKVLEPAPSASLLGVNSRDWVEFILFGYNGQILSSLLSYKVSLIEHELNGVKNSRKRDYDKGKAVLDDYHCAFTCSGIDIPFDEEALDNVHDIEVESFLSCDAVVIDAQQCANKQRDTISKIEEFMSYVI